jgi:hypothetical protein
MNIEVPTETLRSIYERAENIALLSEKTGDLTEQARHRDASRIIYDIKRLMSPPESGTETRYSIVPVESCFRVWDSKHSVERGLYTTRSGAQRRIDELEGRIPATRGAMAAGEDRERNYPCDVEEAE